MKQMNPRTSHAIGHTIRLALTLVVVISLILPAAPVAMAAPAAIPAAHPLADTTSTWVAYNDMDVYQTDINAANVTEHSYSTTNGALVNYSTGAALSITVTGSCLDGSGAVIACDGNYNDGGPANAGTDAANAFGPSGAVIVDLADSVQLNNAAYDNIITFNNLDPTKTYAITLTANRANAPYVNMRYTRVTIQGADTYVNASSTGVVVYSPDSVSFSTGYNTVNGHVAKWTGVTSGPDGSFSIKSEWDNAQGSGASNTKGYAMTAFKLEEEAGTPVCYALTLGHTGNGTTPTASPTNSNGCSAGQYVAGEAISLSGAAADSGWQIASWYGTSNDSSTGNTNSLIMPAGALSAGVNYSEMAVGNYALQFDGSTQYATFGTAGRDSLGLSTFTLELWFRRTGAGTTATSGSGGVVAVPLLTKGRGEGDGSNIDMNYFLGIRASDNMLVADFEDMTSGGNHPIAGVTAIPYATDAPWHHAAVTYDGTKWQLFLDGRLEAELTVGQTPRYDSIQYAALGAALNSCGQQSGGSRTGYTCPTVTDTGEFAGVLDEARIWNVAA